MTNIESTVKTVLEQLKPELANKTWEDMRRCFNRMLKCADSLGITEPCAELYDVFIADDRESSERLRLHMRCVKLIDAAACTQAKNQNGIMYNEPLLPDETEVREFFENRKFPIKSSVHIDYLIVKAEIEMRYLNLTDSTIGHYKHSWTEIRRYFYNAGVSKYNETLLQNFIQEVTNLHNNGSIQKSKWKINRRAAYVLMEVANTGHFHWRKINRDINCGSPEMDSIRTRYIESLKQRNLSKSTIKMYDYVFRKTVEYSGMTTRKDLLSLTPDSIQSVVTKFADICNRRTLATIIPILRSQLDFYYVNQLIKTNLSGVIMGVFIQKSSVAAYIHEKDQANLISHLVEESKRTKAIVLLAMKLGLRDCDICKLTFQEIDWQNDKIRLNQQKTGDPLVLPLLPDVGNALMDYILNERPKRTDRYPYIFLRKQAPYNKLSSVYATCSQLLERQKIKPINGTTKGSHLFRYSLVRRLLNIKVPRQVITDVLGHASKESDKPYISMEESMLRMCALDLCVIGKISWAPRLEGGDLS